MLHGFISNMRTTDVAVKEIIGEEREYDLTCNNAIGIITDTGCAAQVAR